MPRFILFAGEDARCEPGSPSRSGEEVNECRLTGAIVRNSQDLETSPSLLSQIFCKRIDVVRPHTKVNKWGETSEPVGPKSH